ncbi:trypsin-like peptidase domain-containing protein [Streptomyces microflavus]|uniref:VMAP-C domain-containing protein n=1 Tax=Streptomyces microflavus TaxID=1919 RepID=UPI002E3777D7|nr:trypsin-like peptidase domain-containing protein [Streptomyces microflavus]
MSVDGATEGTGFFVAPGFIVSCAHVAGTEAGLRARVRWSGQDYEAVVRAASPDTVGPGGMLYPFPDLAVVELIDPPDGHPCVWLDMARPEQGSALTAVGFADTLEAHVAAPRRVMLTSGGRTAQAGGQLLELVAGEINPGLSGGPVLDHAGAGVCAVVKATRLEDTTMGGFAVPVEALRLIDPEVYRTVIERHDRFHRADSRWHMLSDRVEQDRLGEVSCERADDRDFLGLLSELPDASDTGGAHPAAFLAAAAPGTPLPEQPLLTRRDVYTELTALLAPPPGELPHELVYCADLARGLSRPPAGPSDKATELRDRVLLAAGRLELGDAVRSRLAGDGVPVRRPSVIGLVRHSLRDRSLYHVMVWRYRPPRDIAPGEQESAAVPLREALVLLSGMLARQIDLMGDSPTRRGLIELILPREAVDEDFAAWKLWPDIAYWSLGRKYDLVVRPLERHEAPRLRAAWEERWRHLEGKRVGEALVCVCGRDRQSQAALDATFNNDPALAALSLAGSPRRSPVADAYTVALTSGVPMMLWRRDSAPGPPSGGRACGIPGREACPHSEFLTQARGSLSDTLREDVPDRICELRNAAEMEAEGGDHIGEQVVLLWDDPSRRISHKPLAPPAPFEEGQTR